MRYRLAQAAVFFCLTIAASANAWAEAGDGFSAGDWRFYPTIGITLIHDSNVALTETGKIDSLVTQFSPGVRAETRSDRSELAVSYQAEVARYSDSGRDDFDDHRVNLDWLYNPMLRHAFGFDASWKRGHDQRGTASREGTLALLALNPDSYDQTGFGGNYRFGAPGARGRIELGAHYQDLNYRNNRAFTRFRDREDVTLDAGFFWRIAPKTSAVVSVDRIETNYQFATLDSTEYHYLVGVEFDATARTSGSLLFGGVEKNFDDPARGSFSGTSWRAALKYKLRSYSLLTLSSGRDTDETNGFGDFILRRDVTLGWSHQWNSRFSTTADVGFANDRHGDSGRREDTWFYGFSGQYQFRPWLHLGAGYRDYQRNSNLAGFDYDRQEWTLSLEASL